MLMNRGNERHVVRSWVNLKKNLKWIFSLQSLKIYEKGLKQKYYRFHLQFSLSSLKNNYYRENRSFESRINPYVKLSCAKNSILFKQSFTGFQVSLDKKCCNIEEMKESCFEPNFDVFVILKVKQAVAREKPEGVYTESESNALVKAFDLNRSGRFLVL